MDLRRTTSGEVETNTYYVLNEGKAIIIDPAELNAVQYVLDVENVKAVAVLLTHGHFDHITSAKALQDKGAKIYVHQGDVGKCIGKDMAYHIASHGVKTFEPDVILHGGEVLNIAGVEIKVMHTPGHSAGGVSYIIEDNIFCGDTIFEYSYGRYDFYDGSLVALKESILKLFALEGDYSLYCGHGRETSLAVERQHNPILWS